MTTRKKKPSKHLVTVGTHVPATTKLGLQALAESQNKSVYECLQSLIVEAVDEFYADIDALKEMTIPKLPTETLEEESTSDDGSDLLA